MRQSLIYIVQGSAPLPTGVTTPGTPIVLGVGPTSILLCFNSSTASAPIWKYEIYGRKGADAFAKMGETVVPYWSTNGLTSGTQYDLKVRAYDEDENVSDFSDVGSGTTDVVISNTPDYPQFPLTVINTKYSLPTGNTWTATNTSSSSAAGTGTGNRTDCGLQYALDNCALNDVITTTAGATYQGPFTLPNKTSGSGWIYVVSSALASLPAAGSDVSPSDASNMPTILSANGSPTEPGIIGGNGAHHFRFVGVHVTSPANVWIRRQVSLGESATTQANQCHYIVFDRCLVRPDANMGGVRGFALNGTYLSVINSYVDGFTDIPGNGDSQAIWCAYGYGPYKFHHNFLESSSENIMLGGSNPTVTNAIDESVQITCNRLYKRLAWSRVRSINYTSGTGTVPSVGASISVGGATGTLIDVRVNLDTAPTSVGAAMPSSGVIRYSQVSGEFGSGAMTGISATSSGSPVVLNSKNHLELKQGKKVLIYGNRCENMWNGGQSSSMSFKSTNQDGNMDWVTVEDIACLCNWYINVADGPKLLGKNGENSPETATTRVLLRDLVLEVTGLDNQGGHSDSGRTFSYGSGPGDSIIEHCTAIIYDGANSCSLALYNDTATGKLAYRNNIESNGSYGVHDFNGNGDGSSALDANFSYYTFTHNARIGGNSSGEPSGNFYPANIAAVDFVGGSLATEPTDIADYALTGGSTYHNAGSDGRDLGANITALIEAGL